MTASLRSSPLSATVKNTGFHHWSQYKFALLLKTETSTIAVRVFGKLVLVLLNIFGGHPLCFQFKILVVKMLCANCELHAVITSIMMDKSCSVRFRLPQSWARKN